MKALSLRQPWLWAILHGGKRIENRRWNTHYRGPVLLHAAKGCTEDEYLDASYWMARAFGPRSDIVQSMPELRELPRGGICGRARIVGVVPRRPNGVVGWYPNGVDHRWHMREQYGFVLADVESLPFVPWRGSLGLFEVAEDYAAGAITGATP